MPSKNTNMKMDIDELEKGRRTKFIDAIKAVEDEHGYQITAELAFRPNAIVATIAIVKVPEKKDVVE